MVPKSCARIYHNGVCCLLFVGPIVYSLSRNLLFVVLIVSLILEPLSNYPLVYSSTLNMYMSQRERVCWRSLFN